MNERPELRIGDREREAAATALGEHFASGRITKEEYDERSERAWAARTSSDLAPLFADLPAPHGARQPQPARPTPAVAQPRPPWRGGVVLLVVLVALLVSAAVFRFVPWPVFLVLGILWFKGAFGHSHRHHR